MNRDEIQVKVRHERRDVNARALGTIAGSIVLLGVIGNLGLHGFFGALTTAHERDQSPAHPLAASEPLVPPEPRLQVNAENDLERIRARENENLNGYGWIDRKAERVRIPIERAMALIVERQAEAKKKP